MKNWKFGVLAIGFMICIAFQPQQERLATPAFTEAEMKNLWTIIDEAAVPGTVRNPLLRKLEAAYNAAFVAKPLPQVKDTTKPKKN